MPHASNIVQCTGPDSPHAFDTVARQPRRGLRDAPCPVCGGHGQWNTQIDLVSFRAKRAICDRCAGAGWIETGDDPVEHPDIVMSPQGYPQWVVEIAGGRPVTPAQPRPEARPRLQLTDRGTRTPVQAVEPPTPDRKEPAMLRSFLIGLVAGQRGMTPLAVVATATRRGEIAPQLPLQSLMLNPVIAAGTAAMAAAEMAGDKMRSAPDRIVPIGLAVRGITAAYAGAALAPRDRRVLGATVAVATALASSYVGWRIRCASMRRYGQTATGFVEDAVVFGSGLAIANPALVSRAG